jgi:hypothetical protein
VLRHLYISELRLCPLYWHTHHARCFSWCIVSSPLILGLELSDKYLEPILDIIGNTEAIEGECVWCIW